MPPNSPFPYLQIVHGHSLLVVSVTMPLTDILLGSQPLAQNLEKQELL